MKNKLIYGVGINNADYVVKIQKELPKTNGKRKQKIIWQCPFYIRWICMLERCFSKSYQEKRPSYIGCSVCEEWLTFSKFKSWMETQDWEGKQLDKDLLVYKNKIYSPETCVFVTNGINSFLLKGRGNKGVNPMGVWPAGNSFHARISGGVGKNSHIGVFNTPEEAHQAWQKEKIKQAKILQSEQTDAKVIKGLQRVIDKIQYDLDNNLETKDF